MTPEPTKPIVKVAKSISDMHVVAKLIAVGTMAVTAWTQYSPYFADKLPPHTAQILTAVFALVAVFCPVKKASVTSDDVSPTELHP